MKQNSNSSKKQFLNSEAMMWIRNSLDFTWIKKIVLILLLSFLSSWIFSLLILRSHLMPIGISSTAIGITNILLESGTLGKAGTDAAESLAQTIVYPALNFGLNIPIIAFSFWKLKPRFAINTTIYLISSTLFQMVIRMIPIIGQFDLLKFFPPTLKPIIASVVAGILLAIIMSVIFMLGGSSGGFDPIGMYLQKKTKKPVHVWSLIYTLINIFTFSLIISIVKNSKLGTNLSFLNILQDAWSSPGFLGTLFFIVIITIFINIFYVSNKSYEISFVVSKEDYNETIKDMLNNNKYFQRSHTIRMVKGGFDGKEKNEVRMIMTKIEADHLDKMIQKTDINIFMTISRIKGRIVGQFVKGIDENDIDIKDKTERKNNMFKID